MIKHEASMNAMKSSVRTVEGRAYVYNADGSTAYTFRNDSYLKSFTIDRVGEESKFFGFGISIKANIKARDKSRELTFDTSMRIKPFYVDRSTGSGVSIFTYPQLNITEVHRDENTNEVSITAYDVLYNAAKHTVAELELPDEYTVNTFVSKCASLIGASGYSLSGVSTSSSNPTPNFEGTETIREALNAVAESTLTIYYIDRNGSLTFKRLSIDGDANLTITKDDYFTLESKTNKRLATITHATELGDNVSASTTETGSTQIVRDNPFWELREDIAEVLEKAIAAIGGLTINQFNCSWRGNYLLEPGDKIALTTKDDNTVYSYIINDTITYDGTLSEKTQWNYSAEEGKTDSNPTNLGEALKQTFARVDKANKQIDIVASEVSDNKDAIAAINITTDNITNSVRGLEDRNSELVSEYEALYNEVQTKMSKDDYTIAIQNVIRDSGVESVITKTGFTFDETGLTVDKYNSEMKTTITEDGMKVFKNEEEVLTANNTGVVATNLHANTYLIIGKNSRIEDFGSDRTAIFWIG